MLDRKGARHELPLHAHHAMLILGCPSDESWEFYGAALRLASAIQRELPFPVITAPSCLLSRCCWQDSDRVCLLSRSHFR